MNQPVEQLSQTLINRDHNKKLFKIIQSLITIQQSNIFRRPLPYKSFGWDDYRNIIKKPLDLNLIRRQYNEGKYKTVQQLLSEIQQIWNNVFIYHDQEKLVNYGNNYIEMYQNAIKMQKTYEDLIEQYYPQLKHIIINNNHEKINNNNNNNNNNVNNNNNNNNKNNQNNNKANNNQINNIKQKLKKQQQIQMKNNNNKNNTNTNNNIKDIKRTNHNNQNRLQNINIKNKVDTKINISNLNNSNNNINNNKNNNNNKKNINQNVSKIKQNDYQEQIQSKNDKKKQPIIVNNKRISNIKQQKQKNQMIIQQKYQKVQQPIINKQKQLKPSLQVAQQNINKLPLNYSNNNNSIHNNNNNIINNNNNSINNNNFMGIQQQQSNYSQLYPPPIIVNLHPHPSAQQLLQLSNLMKQLSSYQQQQYQQLLSQIIKILTQYQKQNMIIDGEQVKFKMNQIHISTYYRIKQNIQEKYNNSQGNKKIIMSN